MQEVIKVRHLTKSYHNLPAADNVSFSVNKGMVFGLLGANSAGKSTTIECILGTKKADRGEISVLGMNPLTDRKKLFEKESCRNAGLFWRLWRMNFGNIILCMTAAI